jgi:hypothetical protein
MSKLLDRLRPYGEATPWRGADPGGTKTMKYMLMMSSPRDGYEQYKNWSKNDLEANIAFMRAFGKKLRDSGELVDTLGLASPMRAKLVRAGKDGIPVTDGVFPESKEFLAGYFIIDVESAERAEQVAAELSSAPGPMPADGRPLWVELREIMTSHQEI